MIKVLAKKIKILGTIVDKILKKLMWGTIIRCILQGYLQMTLSSLFQSKSFPEMTLKEQLIACLMLIISLGAPPFSTYFMRSFSKHLNDETFQ